MLEDFHPAERGLGIGLAHAPLLGGARQHGIDELRRFRRGFRKSVVEADPHAASHCHLRNAAPHGAGAGDARSEEQTSELQSLMRISYSELCLKKKKNTRTTQRKIQHK